jgi:hypothetical protein
VGGACSPNGVGDGVTVGTGVFVEGACCALVAPGSAANARYAPITSRAEAVVEIARARMNCIPEPSNAPETQDMEGQYRSILPVTSIPRLGAPLHSHPYPD